jgi:hypothetical protein
VQAMVMRTKDAGTYEDDPLLLPPRQVRPVNWFDVLPPSLRYAPDAPEAGVLRWACLFESDVVDLMKRRGVDTSRPQWQIAREWRSAQGELLSRYMTGLFVELRERVKTFEPMGASLS